MEVKTRILSWAQDPDNYFNGTAKFLVFYMTQFLNTWLIADTMCDETMSTYINKGRCIYMHIYSVHCVRARDKERKKIQIE